MLESVQVVKASNGLKWLQTDARPRSAGFLSEQQLQRKLNIPGKRIAGVADDSKSRRAEDIVGDPEVRLV